jgi:hypothetical protein
VIAALTADHTARDRYLANARAGFGALAVCLTHERADRRIGLLADYDYLSLRYSGSEGAEVIRRDPNDTSGNAAR